MEEAYQHSLSKTIKRAFRSGATVRVPDSGGRSDVEYRIRTKQLGKLCLPSGKLVACNLLDGLEQPFTRKHGKGPFPVTLSLAMHRNKPLVAFAKIDFDTGPIEKWELAVCQDDDPSSLNPGEYFGFPVGRSGMGCFGDPSTMNLLREHLEQSEDNWNGLIGRMERSKWTGFALELGPHSPGAIVFSAGFGGARPSFYGTTKRGKVVSLVTDLYEIPWNRGPEEVEQVGEPKPKKEWQPDIVRFAKKLSKRVTEPRFATAIKSAKKDGVTIQWYGHGVGSHILVRLKQKKGERNYHLWINDNGEFACFSENNRPCGGLRGAPCKHIILAALAVSQRTQNAERQLLSSFTKAGKLSGANDNKNARIRREMLFERWSDSIKVVLKPSYFEKL